MRWPSDGERPQAPPVIDASQGGSRNWLIDLEQALETVQQRIADDRQTAAGAIIIIVGDDGPRICSLAEARGLGEGWRGAS